MPIIGRPIRRPPAHKVPLPIMVHHARTRPAHRKNRLHRLIPTCRESMVAFRSRCDTESVTMSAGSRPVRHDEGSPLFNGTGGISRNPAQASLFTLEPQADAAMTYFYG